MTHNQAWIGWVMALAFAWPQGAQGAKITRISNIQICLDAMETAPDTDDLEPILVSADGSCLVAQTPISI